MLQSMKAESSVFVGKVEFSRGGEGEVVAHHAIDFFTHGLNGDCAVLANLSKDKKGLTNILAISNQLERRLQY